MKKVSSLTIIDNETMRGVIAPAGLLSKEVLIGIIDFIELSSKKSQKETTRLIRDGDKKDSWVTLQDVKDESDHRQAGY